MVTIRTPINSSDTFETTSRLKINQSLDNLNTGKIESEATDFVNGSLTITATCNVVGPFNFKASGSLVADSCSITTINAFSLGGKLTGGANEIEGSNFDINGGAADGITIGGATPAAGTFTIVTSTAYQGRTTEGFAIYRGDSGATNRIKHYDTGIVDFEGQSRARAFRNASQTITVGEGFINFNTETYDAQGEFDSSVTTGTATATSANKLVDGGASFTAADDGKAVWNTTDNTYAYVTAVDSGTQLSLSADIMADTENYTLFFSKFTATKAGYYQVNCQVYWGTTEDQKYYAIRMYRNGFASGNRENYSPNISSGTGALSARMSDVVYMAANDWIAFSALTDAAANQSIYGEASGFFTFVSIHKIS